MISTTLSVKDPRRKVLLAGLLYIFFVVSLTYLNVLSKELSLYQQLDQQLEEAAMTAELLLPPTLHHKDMSKKDLSEEQVFDNILSLSAFTDQRDIIYLYTLILDDHKILFSASSATSEERQSGEKLSFYFDHYDDVDPRVVDIFKAKKKSFLEYTDQWGTFRSVYLPTYSSDGTFYLSVADLSTSHIQSLLDKQIYNSIFIAILFLVFAYPLYYTATSKLKHNAKRLSEETHPQSLALKDNQEKLVQNQGVLLSLAKESFVDQQSALISFNQL
jgi:methyl-accepting chemotaxis protein